MQKITTFLLFEGNAEEAMNWYVSLFPDGKVLTITRYGAGQGGKEGTVMLASFSIKDQTFMCIDSFVKHAFTFTPSMSLYVDCDSEAEINKLFQTFSDGGNILMPLDAYPFSKKYAWLSDKFGVSWQLNWNQ